MLFISSHHRFKRGFTLAVAVIVWFLAASAVHADTTGLAVTPSVIDTTGLPQDLLNYSVTLTNTSDQVENIFPTVNELTADGSQPFTDPTDPDRVALLADWMTVDRGAIMLQPGATATIPIGININPYATAGDYHAVITFAEGGTADQAEANTTGAPQTIINMTVESNAKEDLQVDDFSMTKSFYSGFPVMTSYVIENIGNVPSTPTGKVLFYNKLGEEIGSIDANPRQTAIDAGGKQQFSVNWQNGSGFGQYRAVLDLSYGPSDAKLENVALFWVLPWKPLVVIFGLLLAAIIVVATLLYRAYEQRHRRKMAAIEQLVNSRRKERTVVDLRHPGHSDES